MQQRRVRLGDILDDYCPRERRVTNHAVVAMLEDNVRLTRCTTCESEHPYKEARVPPRRRKKSDLVAAIDDRPREVLRPVVGAPPVDESPVVADDTERPVDADNEPVRRPLIRATLKLPEGTIPPPRPAPEFTVRQTHGRGGSHDGWGARSTGRHGRAEGTGGRHRPERAGAQRTGSGTTTGTKGGWSRQAGGPRTDRPAHSQPGKNQTRRRGKGRHK